MNHLHFKVVVQCLQDEWVASCRELQFEGRAKSASDAVVFLVSNMRTAFAAERWVLEPHIVPSGG